MSFVVIVHDAQATVRSALAAVDVAVTRAGWTSAEVVVVDDGSTDGTVAVVEDFATGTTLPVRVHRQSNQGRLAATRAGARLATGDLVCIIGARVHLHVDALVHLRRLLGEHPRARVWNCHIEIPRERNPQARFWYVLTYLGWKRYLARPRLVDFGPEEFDFFPKGTGALVCPRELLLQGYAAISSIYADERLASDDTALLRWMVEHERIWMSPDYAADYVARSGLGDFARHAYDRGALLLDSYLHPGTRLHRPLIAYFTLFPVAVAAVVRRPALLLTAPVAGAAGAAWLRRQGVDRRDVASFVALAPLFGAVFSAGTWRGLAALVRSRSR